MWLEIFLQEYGYLSLFLGTFLEGETIMVLGGLAAHLGYLDLTWVIASGFAGTFVGDQLYFLLGRRYGKALLKRRQSWRARADHVFRLLQRHQILLITGFRFLYGLRTVTPFVIGMSGIRALKFLVLNAVGGLVWSITVGVLGYLFGQAVETVIGDIKRYELETGGLVVAVGIVVWAIYGCRRYRENRNRHKAA